jgi:Uma2 family endonuclease
MVNGQFVAEKQYTYQDYLDWDEDFRAELIDGRIYMMGEPTTAHQRISGSLFYLFYEFLKGKKCEVFAAPLGVRLFPKKDSRDLTVVVPDLLVICDPAKLDERGCNGAPDLVIEILSPSNTQHDRLVKFNKYQDAGVREYWIVDPEDRAVQVFLHDGSRFTATGYKLSTGGTKPPAASGKNRPPETIPVTVLPGCEIDLRAIFPA